jgi:glycosyltransferase involved in cell wall biosynthesis
LKSVENQSYKNIEHIIIDGNSSDGTLDIVKEYNHVSIVISEKDNGIYDAMNKGVKNATGDIIGILNSDDFFSGNDIIKNVANAFNENIDATIGDIAFVNPKNLDKTVRYYSAKNWKPWKFRWGFMPPHPSFFVRRKFYEKYGSYKEDYKIASDYELLVRMLHGKKLRYKYLPLQIVTMRTGGVSNQNVSSRIVLNQEIVRACGENGIRTNLFLLALKYPIKIFEYLRIGKK